MRRTGSLFLFLLFFAFAASAHDIPSGNLAALGRIWGIVEYAHPWMGYRDVDLDGATLSAIERVRGGATAGVAVDELLHELGDAASHVTRICYDAPAPFVDRGTRMLADDIVYLTATATDARTPLRSARVAVVDLRPQPGRCSAPLLSSDLAPLLVRGTIPYALHRKVRHYGYRPQDGTNNGFDSTFTLVDVGSISGEAAAPAKVVFIADERSAIPPVATALALADRATFVSVGTFPLHSAVDHCQMALGDGSIVTLRTGELVDKDGYSAEPAPMITLPANAAESEVLAAALQLAKPRGGRRRASGTSSSRLGDYEWQADAGFATDDVPPPAQRIFAAYRVWNVMHFFHGGGAWHMPLADVIAKLEHASTRREYELALAAVLKDHASVQAPSVLALHGAAAPPFVLLPVEDKPVVVSSASDQVKPGDELLRIDGRDVAERLAELERHTSPEVAVRDLANGPAGTATFTFRRPDGSQYDVSLVRGTPETPKPAWRILDGNIAYVAGDADFDAIAATRAMILDLRGVTVRDALLARLNTTGIGAVVRVPVLLGGATHSAETAQAVPESAVAKYARRTIALVDERTDLRTALELRALARTQLVGTTRPGGHVSQFVVPGNIRIRFSASELQSPKPDYVVERTIRGLANGRDELLEAALAIAQ